MTLRRYHHVQWWWQCTSRSSSVTTRTGWSPPASFWRAWQGLRPESTSAPPTTFMEWWVIKIWSSDDWIVDSVDIWKAPFMIKIEWGQFGELSIVWSNYQLQTAPWYNLTQRHHFHKTTKRENKHFEGSCELLRYKLNTCKTEFHTVWSLFDSLWQLMTTYDSLWHMSAFDSIWQLLTKYSALSPLFKSTLVSSKLSFLFVFFKFRMGFEDIRFKSAKNSYC